jgi:hypothetical protein
MATIRVDGIGVGQYDANQLKIEAEDYFKSDGLIKKESKQGFLVETKSSKSYLNFPNIKGLSPYTKIVFKISAPLGGAFSIEIRKDNLDGKSIGKKTMKLKPGVDNFEELEITFPKLKDRENLYFLIEQLDNKALQIESFAFLN